MGDAAPAVGVIMGSQSDWPTMAHAVHILEEFGIAPPTGAAAASGRVRLTLAVKCPQCGSLQTRQLSRFSSTSCKALYVCEGCGEPFDHFKAL